MIEHHTKSLANWSLGQWQGQALSHQYVDLALNSYSPLIGFASNPEIPESQFLFPNKALPPRACHT
jgi:hypothetical protein